MLIFNYIINYAQLYFYSILLFNILFCYPIGIFTVQKIPEVVHHVKHKGFCELTSFWWLSKDIRVVRELDLKILLSRLIWFDHIQTNEMCPSCELACSCPHVSLLFFISSCVLPNISGLSCWNGWLCYTEIIEMGFYFKIPSFISSVVWLTASHTHIIPNPNANQCPRGCLWLGSLWNDSWMKWKV